MPVGGLFSMIARLLCIASLLLLVGGAPSSAQIEVYFDQANKADTSVSFGATRPFIAVTRTIWVRNNSAIDIRIKPSITDVNGQASPVVNEFGGFLSTEIIKAGEPKSYTVIYKADFTPFPVDVVAAVRFIVDVEDASTQKPILKQSFTLTGLKTNRLLGTDVQTVDFDSVYVEQSCADTIPVTVYSVTDATVPVIDQRLISGAPVGSEEFSIRTYSDPVFIGVSAITWKCVYRPRDVGPDSAALSLLYKDIQNKNDSIHVKLRGTGVVQQFIARQVYAIDAPGTTPSIRGDTIDLGELPHLYDSVTVGIVVENAGSISVGIDSISARDVSQSQGRCTLRAGSRSVIQANALDTMFITYVPLGSDGTTTYRLSMHTDLGRRKISCIPQWRIVREFVVRGRRRPPALLADVSELDLGTIVKPRQCDVTTQRALKLRNYSIDPCTVDSVSINPVGSGLSVKQPGPFVLQRDGSLILDCIYTPVRTGNESGTITIWLNTAQRTLTVPFTASVVDPDTLELSLSDDLRARPGNPVVVPIVTNAHVVKQTQRIACKLEFNPSLLQLTGARLRGTAADGALVQLEAQPFGASITFELQAGFAATDTLAQLEFATYLGDSSSCNIILTSASTAGSTTCASIFPLLLRHGRFTIDSLCGLSYKTVMKTSGLRGGVFPNPATSSATLAAAYSKATMATMVIADGFGRTVSRSAVHLAEGLSTLPLDVSAYAAGQYIVTLECDGFVLRIPLMVTQ